MGGHNSNLENKKAKRSIKDSNSSNLYEAKILSNEKTKKFVENKKNSKLRLYFIGNNVESIIYDLFFSFLNKKNKMQLKTKNDFNYKILLLDELKWTIYIIDENIDNRICDFIKDEIKEHFAKDHFCFDALIPIIDDINDPQIKVIINQFENLDKQKRKQPFFLFLTKNDENPNRKNFQNLIKSKSFDIRNINVSTIKVSKLEDEEKKKTIYGNAMSKIWKIYSYYNNMGDLILIPSGYLIEKRQLFPYQLNILTCGKPGLGKSSFINLVLNDKRAKEGEGRAVSSEIIRYSHPFFPIAFYDTPGTDTSEAVQMLKEELELYNIKLKEAKKKIHLIIWFLDYRSRVDIKNEKLILENLLKFNAEFLFVINYVNNSISSEEYSTKKEIIVESLEEIFEGKVPDLKDRIIPINLMNQTDEGKIIIHEFGLDQLFYKIYSIFNSHIININLDKKKDKVNFMKEISENKLLSEIIKAEDLKIYLKIEASKYIINISRQVFFSFWRQLKREEMVRQLISMYFGNKTVGGIGTFEDFMKTVFELIFEVQIKQKGAKYYSDLFFDELKSINNIYEFNMDYDIFCYNTYTIAIGYLVIKYLETILDKEKQNLEIAVANALISYAAAVEAIKAIGDDFKKKYKN